jgi:hypothetical protein
MFRSCGEELNGYDPGCILVRFPRRLPRLGLWHFHNVLREDGLLGGLTGHRLSGRGPRDTSGSRRNLRKAIPRIARFVVLFLAASLLSLASAPQLSALGAISSGGSEQGKRKLSVTFEGPTMSADIEGAPLKLVLDEIKEKRGVWYDARSMKDSSILDEDISLHFRQVPLQEGLRRILTGINHSIVFQGSSVEGIMLFGKPRKETYRGRRGITRPRRTVPGRSSRPDSRRR